MDVNRLSQGEKVAAGSAIILFIVMFISWFEAPGGEFVRQVASAVGADTSFNAWQSFDFIDIVLLITVVVAVGAGVAKAADARVNFPLSTLVTVLGALSTILVLYRIINPPSELDRKFGVFLGVIFAAALTYGGWLAMQAEIDRLVSAPERAPGGTPPSDAVAQEAARVEAANAERVEEIRKSVTDERIQQRVEEIGDPEAPGLEDGR